MADAIPVAQPDVPRVSRAVMLPPAIAAELSDPKRAEVKADMAVAAQSANGSVAGNPVITKKNVGSEDFKVTEFMPSVQNMIGEVLTAKREPSRVSELPGGAVMTEW